MTEEQTHSACTHCGHTADGRFVGDICPNCNLTFWECGKCGFLITAEVPPVDCPECGNKCDFLNVTCYTPECGGPGHIDRRLWTLRSYRETYCSASEPRAERKKNG